MTRADLIAEIARLEAATPSKIAAFNADRAAKLADLRARLAETPDEASAPDVGLDRWLECQRRNERAIRNQERRGY